MKTFARYTSLALLALAAGCTREPETRVAPTIEQCRPNRIENSNGTQIIFDLNQDGEADYMLTKIKKRNVFVVRPGYILKDGRYVTGMTPEELSLASFELDSGARRELTKRQIEYESWKQTQAAKAIPSTNDLPYHKEMDQQVPGTQ
jgi:hypothetical protein